jgi:ATP-dependent DNA helicase RecQ
VRDDIVRILQLHNPFVLTTGFDRPNLTFAVQKPASKSAALLDIVHRHADDSGIVYCATRKTVEQVCAALQAKGIAATQYHAGMPDEQRRTAQEDFLYDRCPVMVATNAFGMGIDKSNVAYVVHYNMPKSIENYYQEAGRAGRDGSEAECILLYSPQDVRTNQFFIENGRSAEDTLSSEEALTVQQQDRERLRQMTFYSTTTGCLRSFLLRYFGENAPTCCNKCSNCLTQFETLDATVDAQKIVSCVYRMAQRGQRYGKAMITDVLRGTANERLQRLGLHTLTTYGLMRDTPATRIRTLLDALVQEGYLAVSDGEYPVVQLTAQSAAIVRGEAPFVVKLPKAQPKTAASSTRRESSAQAADPHLLHALKALRRTLANQANVPAYVVFSDATLTDMCRLRPTTLHEFLEVKGVGTAKAKRYGEAFIACIQENISR